MDVRRCAPPLAVREGSRQVRTRLIEDFDLVVEPPAAPDADRGATLYASEGCGS